MAGFMHPMIDDQRGATHCLLAERQPKTEIARALGIHRNTVLWEAQHIAEDPASVP